MFTESLGRDLRIGVRVLLKEKAFAGLAIFVLALGICAVTTQFAVVNGVMLRGFSFPTAERLTDVAFTDPASATSFGVNRQMLSMDYEELAANQKSFERMAAYLGGSTVNITIDGQPRRYTGAYISEDFLRVLGTAPALGRDIQAADNKPGAEKVTIISYSLWQRDYGGAANILGRSLRVNGKPATIIGVMPAGFNFPQNEELWIPLYSEFPVKPRNDPQGNNPAVIGLLRPGVTAEQAQVEVTAIAKRFAAAYPDTNKAYTAAQVQPLLENFIGPQVRGIMWTMLAFCAGVLVIACANVMNMQFGRAILRARELAVRSSLGATRGRLVRQMLTENLLLAGIGGLLGTGLAFLSTNWILAAFRNSDNPPPSWITFDIDGRALAVTLVAMVGAAVVSGLVPAWLATRSRVVDVLREGGRGNTSRGVNLVTRGLVVAQVVVTCFLLVGSLLQMRSILAQQHIDYGYDTEGLMSARMGLMEGDYPTTAARKLFYDRLAREIRENPAWAGAALTSRLRMVNDGSGPVEIDGKTYRTRRDRTNASFEQVTGNYFAVMGQKLLEGRTFDDDDLDTKQPVAIVNAAFARKHFGTASAIGRRFRTGDGESAPYGPWRVIVGVVSTSRMIGPFTIPNVDDAGFYVPLYSVPFGPASPEPAAGQFTTILVRPHPGQRPDAVLPTLRKQVASVDPNLPLYFVGTPRHHLDAAVGPLRVIATMSLAFGAMQLPLGVAMDRWGPKIAMVVCAVVMTAGTAWFAAAATSSGLIMARVLMGAGTSCYLMAPMALYVRRFPPERFNMLAGLHMSVGGIGTLLGTAPLAYAAAELGWRSSFAVMAVATGLVGFVIFAVVREPPSPATARRETWGESLNGIRAAARIPSVGRLFLMQMAIHSSFMIAVGLWGGPYLSHIYGCDLTERGLLLLVPALTQIAGLFAFGLTERVFGAYKPGVVIGSVSMIACFVLLAAFGTLPRGALVAWFAVFGFVNGYMPALLAHGKSLLPPALVGRGMTLLNVGTMGGAFLVQIVSGFVIDLFPAPGGVYPLVAYRTVFVLQALFVAAAVIAYLPARDPLRKP